MSIRQLGAALAFWRKRPPPPPTDEVTDRRAYPPRPAEPPERATRFAVPDPATQKTSWVWFWRIFPALSVLPVAALAAYTDWVVDQRVDEIATAERFAVALQKDAVSLRLNEVAIDICALARQNELQSYIATGDADAARAIAAEYIAIAQNSQFYDQIRYIGEDGIEIVRVNGNHGYPYIVSSGDLQDKYDRYYFHDSVESAFNEVYVSPLDLNVEHGQIETPFNPVIRVGTPVLDDAGQTRGVVIVNYLVRAMLARVQISGTISAGDPFMLNAEGYWLVSHVPERNWGFMFPSRFYQRMAVLYPDAWRQMVAQERDQIWTDNGLFTYDSYYPLADFGDCHDAAASGSRTEQPERQHFYGEYRWILATHVPTEYVDGIVKNAIVMALAIGMPLVFLLAAGTRAVGVVFAQRQRHRAHLEIIARFDPLTRLANRATFEDHLTQEFHRAERHVRRFAVLYLDLDGFKAINDNFGHAAGDAVLQDVAGILSSGCRAVDTPARIGGDEFVILLSEVRDKAAATMVAKRLLTQIRTLDHEGYAVGASIGVALWPDDIREIRQIVQLADRMMYRAKQSGKNRIVVAETLEDAADAAPADAAQAPPVVPA